MSDSVGSRCGFSGESAFMPTIPRCNAGSERNFHVAKPTARRATERSITPVSIRPRCAMMPLRTPPQSLKVQIAQEPVAVVVVSTCISEGVKSLRKTARHATCVSHPTRMRWRREALCTTCIMHQSLGLHNPTAHGGGWHHGSRADRVHRHGSRADRLHRLGEVHLEWST